NILGEDTAGNCHASVSKQVASLVLTGSIGFGSGENAVLNFGSTSKVVHAAVNTAEFAAVDHGGAVVADQVSN
ncbi:MAG: hypothetical protein IIX06_07000, partial [Bacteroidales bacterium]|nr:hypothetical protein [Bacteroidales bacterium]